MNPIDQECDYQHIEELRAQRDELLTICKKLAKWKSGPMPSKRAEWICRVLDLAEQARAAIAKAEKGE